MAALTERFGTAAAFSYALAGLVLRAGKPGTPGALIRNWIGSREYWGLVYKSPMFAPQRQ